MECSKCNETLPLKVLDSAAGYYVGFFCPVCGPYDRLSNYYSTSEEADLMLLMFNTSHDGKSLIEINDYLIRCRQCGSAKDRSLYTEDCYQDVSCSKCGCRTGKYGDDDECINLWNGEGIKFYAVMWQGGFNGILLELHDDKQKADDRAKDLNDMIARGTSIHGYKLDLSRGIRELVSVEEIEPNKPYKIKGVDDEQT